MSINGYLTDEEVRVTALGFARDIAQSKTVTRMNTLQPAPITAKKLIKDAKRIEEYINAEAEVE